MTLINCGQVWTIFLLKILFNLVENIVAKGEIALDEQLISSFKFHNVIKMLQRGQI